MFVNLGSNRCIFCLTAKPTFALCSFDYLFFPSPSPHPRFYLRSTRTTQPLSALCEPIVMPIHNSRTSRTQHQSALVLLSFGCLCARCYGPLVWWFGFFSFGYSCVSYRNPHLGSFQPPKLGLEGLDKLNLFQSLTLLEPTQNFNRSTVSFWVLEEGYLLMIWIMAHTTRLCFTTYLNTIQFFFIRCRTKLVLEHANYKDVSFARFEGVIVEPNSQRS